MTFRDAHPNRLLRFSERLAIALNLLVLSTIAPVALAQDQPAEDVIRIRTDLIAVPVAVTDSRGSRISGLKQDDFALTDDGHAARIDYFASGTARVALAFLLDNSGSLREQLSRQRDAALALFSRFGSGSNVAVIRFGQNAITVAPFTKQTEKARTAFDVPVNLSERTAIFDAAITAVQAYAARADNSNERRIVILLSDGLDTASRASARQVIEAARRANVSFYVIQLPLFTPRYGRLVRRPAAKGFRDVAEKTGGRFFIAGSAQSTLNPQAQIDLAAVFKSIEDDLQSQYVIGFYPGEASRDGRAHRIAVKLSKTEANRLKVHQLKTSYELKQ
jgi:Ca-activated chloride channel family protein